MTPQALYVTLIIIVIKYSFIDLYLIITQSGTILTSFTSPTTSDYFLAQDCIYAKSVAKPFVFSLIFSV
jgi:hypothetical protein